MIDQPDTIVTYAKDLEWQPVGPLNDQGKGIFVSLMYGDLETAGPTAFLMKYSAGVTAPPHFHGHDYYAVVVSGRFRHYLQDPDEYEVLTPGSTWFQKGNAVHGDTCVGDEDCVLSIFWPQGFDVTFIEDATP
ncbi:hypothetical protein BRW65_17980 [Mycobacterium paraffinicum]|uniref:Cupin 2 conserved barrel domain-containing protein n=1 Tax=Mycobacterium paraffinicum TaxID=53378 RepID=A0A1Q4HS49_9MYCO|nr:DUF4437 domain-containing protein [Mycobacterium paraffinicum]OJZ71981.1 hypothetical protein BRW65_17980 [Mycobacterium paraffinicum]